MLDAQLQHPSAIATYLQQRQRLNALLKVPATAGLELARRHAALADGMLQAVYATAQAGLRPRSLPPLLFAAVGGYGRNQLGWKSDLDVIFVTKGNVAEIEGFVEAMLYPLWDAGIAIGHQVMRLDDIIETARDALPTATALLDVRRLAGSTAIARQLRERAFRHLFSPDQQAGFIARLAHEVEERWRRYGDSVYLLEPDVKNGAGGLRDIDVAWWTARAVFHGADWPELVRANVLTGREAQALHDATDFFFRVRNHLHHAANRRNDRLTFDQQEDLSLQLGYGSSVPTQSGATVEECIGPTVEAFMSDYYRHARAVTRAQEHVHARVLDRKRRCGGAVIELEGGIVSRAGVLGFKDPESLIKDPPLALRLYALAVSRGESVTSQARDLISRLTGDEPWFSAALRASPDAAQCFVQLLCTVSDAPFRNGSVLSELHDVGLLLAMIPEFGPVVGRVHHDIYHVYTVDVHSVAATDRIRALMRGELMQRHALACRIAAETHRPQRLFLASLLHDIGKVFGGKEHSIRGAAMTRAILKRFGVEEEDIEHISKLVLHHLTMYFTAARRDLSDPAMIEQFAEQVGDRDCLRNLYLLTIADISTTAPTSMTTWKARMLEELFSLTDERLARAVSTDASEPLRRARADVYAQALGTEDMPLVDELLSSMPERYVLSNTPAEVAAHAAILRAARGKPLHVQLVPSRHSGVAELCFVTGTAAQKGGVGDRPGLLAAIAAALTACKLEIYAAQIYTRGHSIESEQVLDVFWVRDRVRGLEGIEELVPRLESILAELISGVVTPAELLHKLEPTRWSDRPYPHVPTEVGIDNRSSPTNTIIEVVAQDRPGVLFTLSHTLHQLGLSIAFAKVNTEGNRVVDIFYVTELDETKLASHARIEHVKSQLAAALHRPAATA